MILEEYSILDALNLFCEDLGLNANLYAKDWEIFFSKFNVLDTDKDVFASSMNYENYEIMKSLISPKKLYVETQDVFIDNLNKIFKDEKLEHKIKNYFK